MAAVKNTEIIKSITANNYNIQLEGVQNLKKIFNPPDRMFSKLKVESLFQSAGVSLENKKPELDSLYTYGNCIVNFMGKNTTYSLEILHQMELILGELPDEERTDELISALWDQLEKNSTNLPEWVLNRSKSFIERTVLKWVVDDSDHRMNFFAKISADSPKLFQTVTSILYEVLVKTQGHVRVFEVTSSFIESVKRECQNKRKSCLGLYPKGCRRLVSLMRCPPELCTSSSVPNDVMLLLLDLYLTDRKKALILLSHYTKWVPVFKVYLKERDV